MQKKLSIVFGVVFVIVGVLGMVGTKLVGDAPTAYFVTNLAHDLVHLIIGLVMIVVALRNSASLGTVLKTIGVIYLVVAGLGFAAVESTSNAGSIIGLIDVNTADNWLHVVLGVIILGLGLCKCNTAPVEPTTV